MTAIGLSFLAIMGFGSATIFARLGMGQAGPMAVVFISLVTSFAASGILAMVFALSDFATMPLIVLAWCVMLGTFNFLGGRNLSYLAVGRIGSIPRWRNRGHVGGVRLHPGHHHHRRATPLGRSHRERWWSCWVWLPPWAGTSRTPWVAAG